MSRRNQDESACALLRRAASNRKYTYKEKELISVVAELLPLVQHEKYLDIISADPIKSILDCELSTKREEDRSKAREWYKQEQISRMEELMSRIKIRKK